MIQLACRGRQGDRTHKGIHRIHSIYMYITVYTCLYAVYEAQSVYTTRRNVAWLTFYEIVSQKDVLLWFQSSSSGKSPTTTLEIIKVLGERPKTFCTASWKFSTASWQVAAPPQRQQPAWEKGSSRQWQQPKQGAHHVFHPQLQQATPKAPFIQLSTSPWNLRSPAKPNKIRSLKRAKTTSKIAMIKKVIQFIMIVGSTL